MNRGFRHLSLRTAAGALLLVTALSAWQASAPAPAEAVQSDLSYISSSTWTADPVAGRVHVLVVVTATSNTVDAGGRRYYYDRIELPLPGHSTGFAAISSAGTALPVTVESTTAASVIVDVGLGERLYTGQKTTFSIKFNLVDSGGSTDRDFRIGQKLMSFPVSAFGSPGVAGSTVMVVFPAAFTVQEELGNLTRSVYGSGEVVFSSGVIGNSTQLEAWFTAVQPVPPSDFRARSVTVGPLNVTLRYWADDVGWADEVESVLRRGYPILRGMIGLGDPTSTTITIEEASSQDLGFAGSYDLATGQVLISYFADPYVILHEIAHMWFNSDLVSDRWVQEAFASYYAEQAVNQLGLPDHSPVLTDQIRQAAVPLNDWVAPGQPDSPTEAYLYGAAIEVAREIAAEAGQAGLRLVWSAARSHEAAYQPTHATKMELVTGQATDWRRLLDLLEQETGRSYTAIWQQWVLDPSQKPLLQQRRQALADYAAVESVAGSWDLPPEIRLALGNWQFGQVEADLAQARGILSQRAQIAAAATKQETSPPPTLQATFEKSNLAAAGFEAASELEVLNVLAAASQARTDNGDAARAVGLIGTDPEADLVAARAAFAEGNLTEALSKATAARAAWLGASDAGQMRIFGGMCVLAGLLLLVALFFWRRSPGARRSTAAATASSGAPAGAGAAKAMPEPAFAGGSPPGPEAGGPEAGGPEAGGHEVGRADGGPNGRHPHPEGSREAAETRDGERAAETGEGAAEAGDGEGAGEESAYELLLRGTALLQDRHNAQAAVVLERASRLEQSKGSILEALGRAYFNSGQHARAAETFQALLDVDPSAHYGHFALGLSFARLGRAQEARTHLRLAVALHPESETYRRALEKMEASTP